MDSFEGDLRLTTAAGDEQFVLYTLTPPLGKSLRIRLCTQQNGKTAAWICRLWKDESKGILPGR